MGAQACVTAVVQDRSGGKCGRALSNARETAYTNLSSWNLKSGKHTFSLSLGKHTFSLSLSLSREFRECERSSRTWHTHTGFKRSLSLSQTFACCERERENVSFLFRQGTRVRPFRSGVTGTNPTTTSRAGEFDRRLFRERDSSRRRSF